MLGSEALATDDIEPVPQQGWGARKTLKVKTRVGNGAGGD